MHHNQDMAERENNKAKMKKEVEDTVASDREKLAKAKKDHEQSPNNETLYAMAARMRDLAISESTLKDIEAGRM